VSAADLPARIRELRERGCRVSEPAVEDTPAEGHHGESVRWLVTVTLPDGEILKGRGLTPEEATQAAISRAEGAPQLDEIRPKD
jgi:hypothetical protein